MKVHELLETFVQQMKGRQMNCTVKIQHCYNGGIVILQNVPEEKAFEAARFLTKAFDNLRVDLLHSDNDTRIIATLFSTV